MYSQLYRWREPRWLWTGLAWLFTGPLNIVGLAFWLVWVIALFTGQPDDPASLLAMTAFLIFIPSTLGATLYLLLRASKRLSGISHGGVAFLTLTFTPLIYLGGMGFFGHIAQGSLFSSGYGVGEFITDMLGIAFIGWLFSFVIGGITMTFTRHIALTSAAPRTRRDRQQSES